MRGFSKSNPGGPLIGSFTVPPSSKHYKGCFSNPQAALCQNTELEGVKSITTTWTANAVSEVSDVEFVAYIVLDDDLYFTAASFPIGSVTMPTEPCYTPYQHTFVVAYAMGALVLLATLLTCVPALDPLRALLTQKRPLGKCGALAQLVARFPTVDAILFGMLSEATDMTWNELLVILVFLAGQVRPPPAPPPAPLLLTLLPLPLLPYACLPLRQFYSLFQGMTAYCGLGPRTLVAARVIGNVVVMDMALLLLPISRLGLWVRMFGWSFERAIKYHRMLGVSARPLYLTPPVGNSC